MERQEFKARLDEVMNNKGSLMTDNMIKDRIARNARKQKDIPVCIGDLAELTLELTRFQRGCMDRDDFLQELSHVQWTVWSLQDYFGISDTELLAAVQASFR